MVSFLEHVYTYKTIFIKINLLLPEFNFDVFVDKHHFQMSFFQH